MKTGLIILFSMLCCVSLPAQGLKPDTHRSDSIIALLQQQYDPYHLMRTDSVMQPSIMVQKHGLPKVDRRAVYFPGFSVPEQPGIFEEQDRYEWEMGNHTVGEEVLNGVLNVFTDVISDIMSSKKSKKR